MELTQRDIAKAAGISTNMLSRIEGGLSQPSYRMVSRIANVLGVTVDELAAVAAAPPDGTHRLVNLLIDTGMERRNALAIQSRLSRPLRDALVDALVKEC